MGTGSIEGGGYGGTFIGELEERVSYLPKNNGTLENKINSETKNNENNLPAIIEKNLPSQNIPSSEPFVVGVLTGFIMYNWVANVGWIPTLHETKEPINKRREMEKKVYPDKNDFDNYNLGEFIGIYCGSIGELFMFGAAACLFGITGIGAYIGTKVATNLLGYLYYKDRIPKDNKSPSANKTEIQQIDYFKGTDL